MMRDVLSALAGAAGLGVLLLTLSALQPAPPGAAPAASATPPAGAAVLAPTPPTASLLGPLQAPLGCPKKEIVNLFGALNSLSAGVPEVLYAVPAGKELVITDFYFSPVDTTEVKLIEDAQGLQTVRVNNIAVWDVSEGFPVFHGTTGPLFRAGSEVQLLSSPSGHGSIEYHLFGYLVDA